MDVIGEASDVTKSILKEVADERYRQDRKWGEQNHPNGTGSKIFEDYAGIAKRKCDTAAKNGSLTFAKILEEEFWEALAESNPQALRTELIQVAAVAVGWVEAIDRKKQNNG